MLRSIAISGVVCGLVSACAAGHAPYPGADSASLRIQQLGFVQSFGELQPVSPDGLCGAVIPVPRLPGPASGAKGSNPVELRLAPGRYNLVLENQESNLLTPRFCNIGIGIRLSPGSQLELVVGSDGGSCQGRLSLVTDGQPLQRLPVAPDPLAACR